MPDSIPGQNDRTPAQLSETKAWVANWQTAGPLLEEIRREELRNLNGHEVLKLLCGPADYTKVPRAPKPYSGLVEQQRWFMLAGKRD